MVTSPALQTTSWAAMMPTHAPPWSVGLEPICHDCTDRGKVRFVFHFGSLSSHGWPDGGCLEYSACAQKPVLARERATSCPQQEKSGSTASFQQGMKTGIPAQQSGRMSQEWCCVFGFHKPPPQKWRRATPRATEAYRGEEDGHTDPSSFKTRTGEAHGGHNDASSSTQK